MLIISNPEYQANWTRFENAVSKRSKRDPETEQEIIRLARDGLPIKVIKKKVHYSSGAVDAVLSRARRGGLL